MFIHLFAFNVKYVLVPLQHIWFSMYMKISGIIRKAVYELYTHIQHSLVVDIQFNCDLILHVSLNPDDESSLYCKQHRDMDIPLNDSSCYLLMTWMHLYISGRWKSVNVYSWYESEGLMTVWKMFYISGIHMVYHHCVLTYASGDYQPARMFSCTIHIHVVSLHYVLTYGSSEYQPVRIVSHTLHIHKASHQCEFSCVSLVYWVQENSCDKSHNHVCYDIYPWLISG